ncbi:carbohydrate ABC transporter permease [Rhodoligotrophos defluvii]|uniref:carbohydrate ABC transporter permease n=1 Tax=Rhodoligotrophos defluvii TaxID=2561934 RepID=UPI0010C9EB0C|nr:sugar ABC transporter permease [Rhodoligotrophos defluvii]
MTRSALATASRQLGSAQTAARTEARIAWILVLPFLAGAVVFLILPCIGVIAMALSDWQLGDSNIRFAGLQNFIELWRDDIFRQSAANTVFYAALVTPASVILGLWLALLIESSSIGRAFFRSAFFLPVVSTTVAMAIVWEFLLHPSLGPVNALLSAAGLPRQSFLSSASTVLPTLAMIGVWENAGYNMVLFMAGLKAIPRDLHDAAAVDGAHRPWERFWTVTFPLLGPTLVFVVIISFLRSFRVFETVAAITQGGPQRASEVVLFTIYREGFVYFRVGYASALTVAFTALLLTLTIVKFRFLDRRVHYS